jgi:hypothetical protein
VSAAVQMWRPRARRDEPFIELDRLVRACALRIIPEIQHRAWFAFHLDRPATARRYALD